MAWDISLCQVCFKDGCAAGRRRRRPWSVLAVCLGDHTTCREGQHGNDDGRTCACSVTVELSFSRPSTNRFKQAGRPRSYQEGTRSGNVLQRIRGRMGLAPLGRRYGHGYHARGNLRRWHSRRPPFRLPHKTGHILRLGHRRSARQSQERNKEAREGYRKIIQGFPPSEQRNRVSEARHLPLLFHGGPPPRIHKYVKNLSLLLSRGMRLAFFRISHPEGSPRNWTLHFSPLPSFSRARSHRA
jgi:hypothetical protein